MTVSTDGGIEGSRETCPINHFRLDDASACRGILPNRLCWSRCAPSRTASSVGPPVRWYARRRHPVTRRGRQHLRSAGRGKLRRFQLHRECTLRTDVYPPTLPTPGKSPITMATHTRKQLDPTIVSAWTGAGALVDWLARTELGAWEYEYLHKRPPDIDALPAFVWPKEAYERVAMNKLPAPSVPFGISL